MRESRIKISFIVIAFCSFIFGCNPNFNKKTDSKKEKAINSLIKNDSTLYSVKDAMKLHGLKGLSVAVFENYKIVWTGTWGIKDVETGEPIDGNTAFSTASIAKPITATLFAILEEKGLINLKDPVSNYLKRWKLPESEFLSDTELTFEHLLSHTAGTTQHGFADFYEGDSIPILVQSLKGQLPRYDEEISFQWKPGTNWSYSGGGYVIAQMAIEDSLGVSLADLAYEYLFQPLALNNTTMKQPNETDFLTNIAMAHDENGEIVGTGIPITPQVAPSGLWSTPSDLATFVIEIQNALRNKNNTVISNKVAKRVTAIVTSKVLGGWSLGWERRYGFGNYDWFSHGGANTGIGGHIYGTMKDGNGIAFLGNGANTNRMPVTNQFRNSIIEANKWYIPIDKSLEKPMTKELTEMITGKYIHTLFGEVVEVISGDEGLYIKGFIGNGTNELTFIGDDTFLIDGSPSKIKIKKNEADGSLYILLIRNNTNEERVAYRKQF
ncbi:serine hydrolase domain-containing protein [Urechidicola vernalis]|uniref:Serine hydrolase domain-containing protein n=1 Tax=Urechidicola vernalis TaxID=3075600 RepID=A0ABU2Y6E4_9FLAO|nr:serine hydrolase domain-containing protein [Urechidicola sp. P050]MDT0553779.1 serine hydrolase domain-containing protein [Urechidicola sp. P050]